ncbi:MAG: flagellar biosynthetic protein FliR [Porticoccaceae bacterium]
MEFTTAQISGFLGSYFWPLLRISGMLMLAPVFGAGSTPVRVRLGIGLVITWVLYPLLPAAPAVEPLSATGIVVTFNQLLLGVATGFIFQLVFGAVVLGAQTIAMTMGLGFAQFIDPEGEPTVVLGTFYTLLGTLLFLALNGHLVLIQVLAESFHAIPVGASGLSQDSIIQLVLWGSRMFAGGLLIALPAVLAITLINVAFGVVARAAPQVNIFGVLFPVTMVAGFAVMLLTLPSLLPRFTALVMDGFDFAEHSLLIGS